MLVLGPAGAGGVCRGLRHRGLCRRVKGQEMEETDGKTAGTNAFLYLKTFQSVLCEGRISAQIQTTVNS